MAKAYGWAFSSPASRVYYNLIVTSLSVLVALLIGSVELLQVLTARLHLHGGVVAWLDALDFQVLGYVIVALFAVSWAGAVAVWKLRRMDERWGGAVVRTGDAA
jgi:high-affinity nickel-transport protein